MAKMKIEKEPTVIFTEKFFAELMEASCAFGVLGVVRNQFENSKVLLGVDLTPWCKATDDLMEDLRTKVEAGRKQSKS